MKAILEVPGAPAPVGPYSPAVTFESLVFCSGQIGLDPEVGSLKEGLTEQLEQVLKNVEAVLNASGSNKDSILMSSIFLSDIGFGAEVNERYAQFVNAEAPPARQTVAVKALPLGALVEISVIAKKV